MRKDYLKFLKQIGMLDFQEVWDLGFVDTCFFCSFSQVEAEIIKKFCRDNPQYHIISSLYRGLEPGRYVNKYLPEATALFLGLGDANPDLNSLVVFSTKHEMLEKLPPGKTPADYYKIWGDEDLPDLSDMKPKFIFH
jgi:hypothetical protein